MTAVIDHDVAAENRDLHPATQDTPELPADAALLNDDDRALLEIGMEDLWSSLNPQGRVRLLERLRARKERLDRKERMRRERSELCARYVDLLCSMPRPTDPGYAQARADLLAAKSAYLAAPKVR